MDRIPPPPPPKKKKKKEKKREKNIKTGVQYCTGKKTIDLQRVADKCLFLFCAGSTVSI